MNDDCFGMFTFIEAAVVIDAKPLRVILIIVFRFLSIVILYPLQYPYSLNGKGPVFFLLCTGAKRKCQVERENNDVLTPNR